MNPDTSICGRPTKEGPEYPCRNLTPGDEPCAAHRKEES